MKLSLIAIILAPSLVIGGPDYTVVDVGASKWPRTSNGDQFEAASTPGAFLSIRAGERKSPRWATEIDFSYRRNDAHGVNPNGLGLDKSSADGTRVHGLSLHANAVYSAIQRHGMSADAFVGVGVTSLVIRHEYTQEWVGTRINETVYAPSAQMGIEAGYMITPTTRLGVGYRYLRPMDMSVGWNGYDLNTNYDAHTLYIGVTSMH